MPIVTPYIPQNITVHLGPPNQSAENVTVRFIDYVKNVTSSEIYPTWEESAIRANMLAITSFALNRIYTEYYRSRGYNFDITSSTAYDQFFVKGRSYFENISRIADSLFNDYLRRPGFVEPLAAKFCNGTTVTCEGLSQWGSQKLAQQGKNEVEILKSYYGNVEIVKNAPIRNNYASYPGRILSLGSAGPNVVVVQVELNRIAQNYPAIPKVPKVDGIYGAKTKASVQKFQEVFDLSADGIVGPDTWYALVRLYTAVLSLSELRSQGQKYYINSWTQGNPMELGERSIRVEQLQYMLKVLSAYIPDIPRLSVDGIFGASTKNAVLAAQARFELPQTGIVDGETWDEIYNQYEGIENTSFRDPEAHPYTRAAFQQTPPDRRYADTSLASQFRGSPIQPGDQDPVKQEVVR